MAKNERRMARKPATKFPNLRKKLQKGKIQSRQAKKKRQRGPAAGQESATIKAYPSPAARSAPGRGRPWHPTPSCPPECRGGSARRGGRRRGRVPGACRF